MKEETSDWIVVVFHTDGFIQAHGLTAPVGMLAEGASALVDELDDVDHYQIRRPA